MQLDKYCILWIDHSFASVTIHSIRRIHAVVREDRFRDIKTTLCCETEVALFIQVTSGCVHNVKKFDNTGEDLEDLISIGTNGLIKAIESFQTGKGIKLAAFTTLCIENEILMHLRSLKKTRKDVSLHDPANEAVL
jgi:hypothetical protein